TRSRVGEHERREVNDAFGYTLTRARLEVLTSSTPEKALESLRGQRQDPTRAGDLGVDYGIALARMNLRQYAAAREDFQRLRAEHPDVIHFHSGLAMAELALGNRDAAFDIYEKAMGLFPRNVPLTIRYAEALLRDRQAKKAHQVLLDLLNNVPPTAEQVRLIAVAASEAGDTADAHYYMAEFHLLKGDAAMAADQLRLALSIP